MCAHIATEHTAHWRPFDTANQFAIFSSIRYSFSSAINFTHCAAQCDANIATVQCSIKPAHLYAVRAANKASNPSTECCADFPAKFQPNHTAVDTAIFASNVATQQFSDSTAINTTHLRAIDAAVNPTLGAAQH